MKLFTFNTMADQIRTTSMTLILGKQRKPTIRLLRLCNLLPLSTMRHPYPQRPVNSTLRHGEFNQSLHKKFTGKTLKTINKTSKYKMALITAISFILTVLKNTKALCAHIMLHLNATILMFPWYCTFLNTNAFGASSRKSRT